MRRPERAMTLLEVMAAVALLGILYTYLARAATQGVHTAADSRRRMEASLLVDERLALIETDLANGGAPQPGSREEEDGDFLVVTEVTPFPRPASLVEPPPGTGTTAEGPSLFGGAGPNDPSLVQRISVRVIWQDGPVERSVERVTFGFDANEVGDLVSQALEAGE